MRTAIALQAVEANHCIHASCCGSEILLKLSYNLTHCITGAFTPGCSVRHLPGFIENLEKIKGKSVDVVAVIAYNDAFVMNAWSKANGIKNDDIVRQICPPRTEIPTGMTNFLNERDSSVYTVRVTAGADISCYAAFHVRRGN